MKKKKEQVLGKMTESERRREGEKKVAGLWGVVFGHGAWAPWLMLIQRHQMGREQGKKQENERAEKEMCGEKSRGRRWSEAEEEEKKIKLNIRELEKAREEIEI